MVVFVNQRQLFNGGFNLAELAGFRLGFGLVGAFFGVLGRPISIRGGSSASIVVGGHNGTGFRVYVAAAAVSITAPNRKRLYLHLHSVAREFLFSTQTLRCFF